MESASSIKEAGEQSAVVEVPPKRCEGCGKPTRIKCSKCNFFAYCSKRCQAKLWPRHKYVCERILDIDINPDACACSAEWVTMSGSALRGSWTAPASGT